MKEFFLSSPQVALRHISSGGLSGRPIEGTELDATDAVDGSCLLRSLVSVWGSTVNNVRETEDVTVVVSYWLAIS